jgi:hypothetical protein
MVQASSAALNHMASSTKPVIACDLFFDRSTRWRELLNQWTALYPALMHKTRRREFVRQMHAACEEGEVAGRLGP